MILHSIIPSEVVLDWQSKPEKTVEFNIDGTIVEAFEMEGSRYKIKRVISTSLNSYLNSQIKPDSEFEIKLGQY